MLSFSAENGSGKTSLLQAIWQTLEGSDRRATPEPVKEGTEEGDRRTRPGQVHGHPHVECQWRRFDHRRSSADGERSADGADLLKSLLGEFALDPVAFLDAAPRIRLTTSSR